MFTVLIGHLVYDYAEIVAALGAFSVDVAGHAITSESGCAAHEPSRIRSVQ
jgi:hypothetical protein